MNLYRIMSKKKQEAPFWDVLIGFEISLYLDQPINQLQNPKNSALQIIYECQETRDILDFNRSRYHHKSI